MQIDRIRYWEGEYTKLSDADLKVKVTISAAVLKGGESLNALLPEAFGLVCVSAYRVLQLRPYDVQLAGGVVMHQGTPAELNCCRRRQNDQPPRFLSA